MKLSNSFAAMLLALATISCVNSAARADLIYESATTSVTGPASLASGTLVNQSSYTGVNFYTTNYIQVDRIGGHFYRLPGDLDGTFFGAIVPATSQFSVPAHLTISGLVYSA